MHLSSVRVCVGARAFVYVRGCFCLHICVHVKVFSSVCEWDCTSVHMRAYIYICNYLFLYLHVVTSELGSVWSMWKKTKQKEKEERVECLNAEIKKTI